MSKSFKNIYTYLVHFIQAAQVSSRFETPMLDFMFYFYIPFPLQLSPCSFTHFSLHSFPRKKRNSQKQKCLILGF